MSQPNILYLIPDEWRQRGMGFRGEDPVLTPNIDHLAAESVELENVISNYPVCTPHRGMLFTGQYPCTARVMGNANSSTSQFMCRLPVHTTCLPDVLDANGYYCGYVGKWHLDSPVMEDQAYLEEVRSDGKVWDAFTPESRRHHFKYWFSFGCNDQHYQPHYWDNTNKIEERSDFPGMWSPEVEAERVIDFIKNKDNVRPKDQPFFLMWAPNPPHMPFEQVPQRFKDLFKDKSWEELLLSPAFTEMTGPASELPQDMQAQYEANMTLAKEEVRDYFAQIAGVDYYIGEVLKALDEAGLKEDTLVVFASDHGDLMGSHGLIRKGPWFDDSVKIPYLIRWPGKLKPGKRNFLMNTPDIFPTLVSMVGLKDQLPSSIEGQDLSRFIMEEGLEDSIAYQDPSGGLAYFINAPMNARGVRSTDYYLVVLRNHYDEERYILYDLKKDPYQLKDVASEKPEVVQEYRALLQTWLEDCKDWWLL
jgi:arylsulfatase A-like enzyme